MKKISPEKNILFVCIENSNRSQMAEAFGKIHGQGIVNAFSAGSRPSGKINPKAIEAMKMISYDLAKHSSKSADDFRNTQLDYVITMGCGDECPFLPAKYREDWDIPDPKDLPMNEFIVIRNLIEQKVKGLLSKIKTENENQQESA